MLENLKAVALTIPVWVYVILGILLAGLTVLCAVRTDSANRKRQRHVSGYTTRTVVMRGILTAICAAAMVLVLVGCSASAAGNGDQQIDPPDSSQQGEQDPPEDPDPPAEPLPAVNLTAAQIEEFLKDYSLEFDDSSLTFGVGWKHGTPTMAEKRIAAIKEAGGKFEDGLAFPYERALELIDQFKSLPDAEKVTFVNECRHDIYQSIIANPVVGMAWLEMFAENDLILENNAHWILPTLEILQSMYDGSYTQPQPGDPGYAEAMKVELNNIPNSTDVTSRGLDLLLVYNGPRLEVRQSWARVGARICGVLEYFSIEGFTNRTSSMNFVLLPTAEDSMVRPSKADYQESETAILLVYGQKNGKEAIAYGVNVYDGRPEEFKTNVKEPPVTPPKDNETPPETPPTTPPPVTPPPTNEPKDEYGPLLVRYLIYGTNRQVPGMTNHSASLKVGSSYNIITPVPPAGYALYDQSQSVVRSSRYGTMIKSGRTIDVYFVAEGFTVTRRYIYEDGREYYPPETSTVKVGDRYSFDAKPCRRNYWVDPENYSGTMPAQNITLTFVYHYLYLEEWKDPNDGSAAQGNAPIGGGENLPTDGTGNKQTTEPGRTDYPAQGSTGDPSTNGGRTDLDANGNSTTPLTPSDQHESSGQGGNHVDHTIVDQNGGQTDGGTPPEKNPIDVTHDTTVTNPNTGKTEAPENNTFNGAIGEPD